MANDNGDTDWLNMNSIAKAYTSTSRQPFYDNFMATTYDPNVAEASINDITGAEMLEVIQKGVYKTLVTRRDDAKAIWEEEDDDASYGEYKALKDAVELLDTFLHEAPKARYSGLKRPGDYGRYDKYGQRY